MSENRESSREPVTMTRVGHPPQVEAAHARALAATDASSRFIEIEGRRVHLIEQGDGVPLVLLHGSGPSALMFLPLLAGLTGIKAIAVDRPGFGLSDPPGPTVGRYRDFVADWIDELLDALEFDEVVLLGSSTGGTASLWYTQAHAGRVRRLVLVGALPGLGSTDPPPPLLAVATAAMSGPAPERPSPSAETVIQSMAVMNEADTIVRYPVQIDALIAADSDPVAGAASITELRALIATDGWQSDVRVGNDELGDITAPALLIWGDNDPLGGTDSARVTAAALPNATLEMVHSGHAPWLGHPDAVASLISDFVTS